MKHWFNRINIALALVCLSGAPLNAQQDAESDSPSAPRFVPLFTLTDHNGNKVSLESYRGSIVMINFWATWCPPCIEEMPTMQALKAFLADQPFEILAVNMGEEKSVINTFIERIGIDFSFPLLLDPTTSVAMDYQVSGLPATLLVDRQGAFVFGGVGPRDWNSDKSRNQILALLAP